VKIETILLIAVPTISILSLKFVPKKKAFQAQYIFLFTEFITWILGLTAVQLGLIEYPYREFSTVNRTSFSFEYLVLPIMCIHFNVRYPRHASKAIVLIYYLGIALMFTVAEYIVEKYTLILDYTGWHLYWTFISICFVFWLSRKSTQWFFKGI
jgi:hypothetical protein